MNYFVGNSLGANLTGIEKAIINRLKLFKEMGRPAQCVFLSWNRFLYRNAQNYLSDGDYINMYDYFQEALYVDRNEPFDWLSYWTDECHYILKPVENSNDFRIYDQDRFLMYAHFQDPKHRILDYVNHFDRQRRKVKRDFYDVRGFLSCSRILVGKQQTLCEFFYNPDGNTKIEKYYTYINDKPEVQKIIVYYANKSYFFNSDTDLGAFFITNIYRKGDLFFSDRNVYTAPIFNLTPDTIPVVAVLHSTHIKNIDELDSSPFKNVYKAIFENLSRYRAIVVSTEQQKIDVSKRIHNEIPVVNIPVGYSEPIDTPIQNLDHRKIKLISVARYSPEKQLHQQIELIKRLVPLVPNVELHMYGFGSESKKLNELIQKYGLENHVYLRGFLSQLDQEYSDAYLSLITSNMEGFSLALLESLSHGVPVISYDIKYGPSELISPDINGYLIPKNDEDALFEKVKYVIEHPEEQQRLSVGSLTKAQQYSKASLINQWDQFIQLI
ncbi:serine-aspartate repeat adhesin O-glycosyltransferase SdgB [Staphylococcus argenteus]